MKKKELVYREILTSGQGRITQLGISKNLGISISTVNNAIKPLVRMGAIQILPRGLKLTDREKIIIHWANERNLDNDLIYKTRHESPVDKIESAMPSGAIFTAYSGYKFRYKDAPADYSEVYIYADGRDLEEIKARFAENNKTPNIFVLRLDRRLVKLSKDGIAPDSQLFVDLWNLKEWYAKDFVTALRERLL